jgi:hypothetical protein
LTVLLNKKAQQRNPRGPAFRGPVIATFGNNERETIMKKVIAWSVLIVFACTVSAFAQNKVVFDNQSGEPALVKLIGPTQTEVEVPTGAKAGADAAAGRYVIKVRYGTPGKYRYSKGQEFEVKETTTTRSETTITLHKVVAGNYETEPISEDDFGRATTRSVATTRVFGFTTENIKYTHLIVNVIVRPTHIGTYFQMV